MPTTPSPSTSVTLLERLQRNPTDQEAWAELVRRYGPLIYRWCLRWRLQKTDAQEVTQRVLVTLADRMRTFHYDPTGSFRAYLKTLARYAWCDLEEDCKRFGVVGSHRDMREVLEQQEAREDLVQRLNEEFDQEVLQEARKRVRQRVEPQTWEAFQLTAVEGLSGAEGAARLGMRVVTVYKAKSKVQTMLREEIARLEGT
jgi:RNA polymerase sigma-70 factor (ECF subfamily)